MDAILYFAISELMPYIASAVAGTTGLVMLFYFSIKFYQFFDQSIWSDIK